MATQMPAGSGRVCMSNATILRRFVLHRSVVLIWLVLAGAGGLLSWVLAAGAIVAIRESRQSTCKARLLRLGAAMHEHHTTHERLPAPALLSPQGKKLLSWRVAILPQLGYRSLYERFHHDEPWDSPHNRPLIAEMPPEFACPAGPARHHGQTSYLVIVGPEMDAYSINTPFESSRGADIRHITDGVGQTILMLETDVLVEWTRPDDLHWTKGAALPHMTSAHSGGAHACFADGSVRFLHSTINAEILLGFITSNGGEVLGKG